MNKDATLADPLGIDWARITPQARVIPQFNANTPSRLEPSSRFEADALVLVVRKIKCKNCDSSYSCQEDRMFLRAKGHFTQTLQEIEIFQHLPRETKILHSQSIRCEACFRVEG